MNGSELSPRSAGLTRAVISVVQLEQDPLSVVDRVLATVVHAGVLDGTPEEYREALAQALARNVSLAKLLPEYHPEPVLRRYVAELHRRLSSIN
jgi:hypothetical protein